MEYTVKFEQDEDGWWVAQVKEYPAALTQGRTLGEARQRIREALALVLNVAVSSIPVSALRDEVVFPKPIQGLINRTVEARRAKEKAERETKESMEALYPKLRKYRLSNRDIGSLLGTSGQNVHKQFRPHAVSARKRRS